MYLFHTSLNREYLCKSKHFNVYTACKVRKKYAET